MYMYYDQSDEQCTDNYVLLLFKAESPKLSDHINHGRGTLKGSLDTISICTSCTIIIIMYIHILQ